MTCALYDPKANRSQALLDASTLMAFVSDLFDGVQGDGTPVYSEEAEMARLMLTSDLAQIVGAIARADLNKVPGERDDRSLAIIADGAIDKITEAQRFTRLIADHFLNCGDPLTFSRSGARGLGLLMDIVSRELASASADYHAEREESRIVKADEAARERMARLEAAVAEMFPSEPNDAAPVAPCAVDIKATDREGATA